MNRISNELRNDIVKILSKEYRNGNIIVRYILPSFQHCTKWRDVLNIDENSLLCFIEKYEEISTPFLNNFEARATYKIFFMFIHEALPIDIRNNPYVRVIDIYTEFRLLPLPVVDFNDPIISGKITRWLNEIPNNA